MHAQLCSFSSVIEVGREESSNLLEIVLLHFGLYLQDFGQVRVLIIPYCIKHIRKFFIFACSLAFILICDQYWQGGVLKCEKNGNF